jgi:hypothetical protein
VKNDEFIDVSVKQEIRTMKNEKKTNTRINNTNTKRQKEREMEKKRERIE